MCLAIFKPAKATITKADMQRAFTANPDGAGFAYFDADTQRVEIQRGYFTFAELWRDLEMVNRNNLTAIIHFRWATHGDVTAENCHPFALSDGALIHNGIIASVDVPITYTAKMTGLLEDETADRSDTRIFCEDYIANMSGDELRRARRMIEKFIGWSKLVTLHDDGSHTIFNEASGHWNNGAWYSNHSYAKQAAKVYTASDVAQWARKPSGITSSFKPSKNEVKRAAKAARKANAKAITMPLDFTRDEDRAEQVDYFSNFREEALQDVESQLQTDAAFRAAVVAYLYDDENSNRSTAELTDDEIEAVETLWTNGKLSRFGIA